MTCNHMLIRMRCDDDLARYVQFDMLMMLMTMHSWWWCVRMWMNSGCFWELLTGSLVVMRVDRSRRVAVCVTVHGLITVSGSGYSLGRGAGLVVDALEHRRVVWPPSAGLRRILGADVIGPCTRIANRERCSTTSACVDRNESIRNWMASRLPFRDRMYDCQNFAFLLAVSLRPIISKCCLNILKAGFYVSFAAENNNIRYKLDQFIQWYTTMNIRTLIPSDHYLPHTQTRIGQECSPSSVPMYTCAYVITTIHENTHTHACA